jgi:hypothetical protein
VDDIDLRVAEECVQVGGALFGRTGDEVVAGVDSRRELDSISLRLPPLDPAQEVRAVLPWARRRRDTDGAAVGERAGEKGGRFQNRNLPA